MPNNELKFAHRHNLDGTFDSICTRCFQTVGNARDEAKLERAEERHVCDPHLVRRFGHTLTGHVTKYDWVVFT